MKKAKQFKFTFKGIKFTVIPAGYSNTVTGGTNQENREAEKHIAKKLWKKYFGAANIIIVHVRTWFDKTYGNTYGTATATIFDGSKEVANVTTPFQYGYGNFHETEALNHIKEVFYSLAYFEQIGIKVLYSKSECKYRQIKDTKFQPLTINK